MSNNPAIYPIFYTAALYLFSRMEREKLKQTVSVIRLVVKFTLG